MKKLLVVILLLVSIQGCQDYDKVGTTQDSEGSFDVICVDNVEYLMKVDVYNGFMTAHFKPDGSIYTCE